MTVTPNAARDRQVSDLIDAAQSYSSPRGRPPGPPPAGYLPSGGAERGEAQELERRPAPPWFQPIDHPDGREPQWEEGSGEIPVIDGEAEVAEPSADEQARIDTLGVDALAYYAPFHFYHRTHWGIYIRDYGAAYLASQFVRRRTLTRSDNWVLRCAYWLLFEHEYFHFQTEVATTRYEVLTGDRKAYEHMFHDRRASWLEEGMANARAHCHLHKHEDCVLTVPLIHSFRGFASNWMKTQPPGYRDYDRWCKSPYAMNSGRGALTSRLHEISTYVRHAPTVVNSDALRPYANADYSRVPVVRVHDSGIPWLKSARMFPKAHGIQVMVYTREHPPAHIHVEFLDSNEVVKLGWPSLAPLPGESTLSARKEKDLEYYLATCLEDIDLKVNKVFHRPHR